MAELTLLIATALSLVAAGLYFYISRALASRMPDGEARLALWAFRAWWLFLALSTAIGLVPELALGVGSVSLGLLVATNYVNLALICVALWGLLYYLVYLYTGKHGAWKPLAAFYVLYFAFLMYVTIDANPIGVVEGPWSAELVYETPIEEHPLWLPLILLLVLPEIGGALAYLLLFFKVNERAAKYRVVLISGSILVWFGSALLASISGLGDYAWWFLASRAIGLGAALAILAAYKPPAFVKRLLGMAEPEATA